MIHAIRANHPFFRDITLRPGLNVILADRTLDATKRDSRNGLGKSTLIEIVHFCLGGSVDKRTALASEALAEWSFSLEFEAGPNRVTATRRLAAPREVVVEGDVGSWPLVVQRDVLGQSVFPVQEWNATLGALMFGLPSLTPREFQKADSKYRPSYRSLISYFARRGPGAYLSPFQFFEKQPEWELQVFNLFLLGLNWLDASDWQVLKDRRKDLAAFEKVTRTPVGQGVLGTLGELEAAKVRLHGIVADRERALRSFKVHPQYRELEKQANELTQQIHDRTDQNIVDSRLLAAYRDSLRGESAPSAIDVAGLFSEAGVELPGAVIRRLDEVGHFHAQIVENRRAFLSGETRRLERQIATRSSELTALIELRAELLSVLQTHGALEEYTRLQEQHTGVVQELRAVEAKIDSLKQLQRERSTLRIDLETLRQRARLHFDEARAQRDAAIKLFNENSEALYDAPGTLVIDVGENGFKFDVEIERSGSHGIENMKIFCYDLALAELAAGVGTSPGFLMHDSTIFDGVDERQVARALELAASRAERAGFQYIVTMNSDTVPYDEFTENFEFNSAVRHRLTDASERGSLLGMRVRRPSREESTSGNRDLAAV